MIIDDKWQKEYGTLEVDPNKWTDLRGFVDEQKAKGIHVLLWFKMWDSEGLPEDMCVKGVAPVPVMANSANRPMTDPTNPKYREFLKKAIYHLLSSDEGCCNADGFKLDFAFSSRPVELFNPMTANTALSCSTSLYPIFINAPKKQNRRLLSTAVPAIHISLTSAIKRVCMIMMDIGVTTLSVCSIVRSCTQWQFRTHSLTRMAPASTAAAIRCDISADAPSLAYRISMKYPITSI